MIARAAKKVFAQLPHKILDPATNVLEMNAYRSLVLCLPAHSRAQLERVLEQRGYLPDVSALVGPAATQRFRDAQVHYEEVADSILEHNTQADEWAEKYHKQVQIHLKGQSQQRLLTRRAYTSSILDASGFKVPPRPIPKNPIQHARNRSTRSSCKLPPPHGRCGFLISGSVGSRSGRATHHRASRGSRHPRARAGRRPRSLGRRREATSRR